MWIASHATNCFDRMSMASSLEVRSSFLDHDLVELSQTIPIRFKVKNRETKWILKETFKDLIPREIRYREIGGMLSPSSYWLKNQLKPLVKALLSPEAINRAGLLNPDVACPLVNGHLERKRYAMLETWTLMSLQLWHEMFIQKTRKAP